MGARGEGICCIFVLNDPVMKKLLPIIVLLLAACGRNVPDAGQFGKPGIVSMQAMDITESGVTLVAEVTMSKLIAEQGFEVWPAGGKVMEIQATLNGNRFAAAVSNLSAGCEYHFVAYAGNGFNMDIRSEEGVFCTLKREEQVPPDTPDTPPDTPDTPPAEPTYIDFPDANLSAWMLWFFDEDKDGRLSKAEAEKVTTVEVSTMEISSLEGIEHLAGLTKLDATGKGENSRGLLTSLDVSRNNRLAHLYLVYNNISSMTLGLQPNLYFLDVDYNELEEFDPRPYERLNLLQLSYNKLRSLDFTGLDSLDELHCNDNPLESITLCNATLRYIDCSRTNITCLDLSQCPKINEVDCSGCTYLTTIYLAKGQIVGTISKPESATIVYYE